MQPDGAIEIVRQRVTGSGRLPQLHAPALATTDAQARPVGTRPVWIDTHAGWVDTPVYEGAHLHAGHVVRGPAVIDEHTTTVLVGCGDTLRVDASRNYAIDLHESGDVAPGAAPPSAATSELST